MNFGETIKQIRKDNQLTQDQFAQQLNVTRQAVSNWENNKNFPDIEILIFISEKFNVSLDTLIKGEPVVTKKIIQDGSETRRSRYNMIALAISAFFIFVGILLLLIKGISVEYIDAQGILHENFFLIPLGFLSIFCGLIALASTGVNTLLHKFRKQ